MDELDSDGTPEPIRVAVRQTIEWARLHNADLNELSQQVTQMFLTYLAYAGGEVNDFDWVLKRKLCMLYDFQYFLEALDEQAEMGIMSLD
jgi:hypothetical protein